MKQVIIESLNLDDAYEQAEEQLKATKDQISFVVEEHKNLFGNYFRFKIAIVQHVCEIHHI